jgi:hypothetical protein
MYHKSEYCNWEANFFVVVRNERVYLTASDLDPIAHMWTSEHGADNTVEFFFPVGRETNAR